MATATSVYPVEAATMAPLILDADANPFGLLYHEAYSGSHGGLDYNDLVSYSSGCNGSGAVLPVQYHTTNSAFPRSLSNTSTVSAASSVDSVDGYSSGGVVGEDEWQIPPYSGLPLNFINVEQQTPHMSHGQFIHEFVSSSSSGFENGQVLSAPLMSSPSYSQDHEPQTAPPPIQFHHHIPVSSTDSPGLLPSSLPLTPPMSSSKGSSIIPPHHHHQFPVQPRLQTSFKRPFQPDSMSAGPGPHSPPSAKRRKSMSATTPSSAGGSTALTPKSPKQSTPLTEDDNLLLKLKDEENLPWKLIQKRFLDLSRGDFKVPTLQMRYKRLKEKMRVWEADDVGYLKEAKDAVSKEFWEMVSRKMVEMGCKKKIPGVACERKWRELDGAENKEGNTRESSKAASPRLGEDPATCGMVSPPATRSPSRRSSVSGAGMMQIQPMGSMPLPSSMVQQLAVASAAPAAMGEVQMIKRELDTVTEGDEN